MTAIPVHHGEGLTTVKHIPVYSEEELTAFLPKTTTTGQVSGGQLQTGQTGGQFQTGQVSGWQLPTGRVSTGQTGQTGQVSGGQFQTGQVSGGQLQTGQTGQKTGMEGGFTETTGIGTQKGELGENPLLQRKEAAPEIERLEKPTLTREYIHPIETTQVQPVIYRERQQTEIRQVIQPFQEETLLPVEVITKELPLQDRGQFKENDEEFLREYEKNLEKGFVEVLPVERKQEILQPIVQETIRHVIREEIHPIIYRHVTQPHIIKQTVPIIERVLEKPYVIKETRPIIRQQAKALGQVQAQTLESKQAQQMYEEKPLQTLYSTSTSTELPSEQLLSEGIQSIPLGPGKGIKIAVHGPQPAKVHVQMQQAMPS